MAMPDCDMMQNPQLGVYRPDFSTDCRLELHCKETVNIIGPMLCVAYIARGSRRIRFCDSGSNERFNNERSKLSYCNENMRPSRKEFSVIIKGSSDNSDHTQAVSLNVPNPVDNSWPYLLKRTVESRMPSGPFRCGDLSKYVISTEQGALCALQVQCYDVSEVEEQWFWCLARVFNRDIGILAECSPNKRGSFEQCRWDNSG